MFRAFVPAAALALQFAFRLGDLSPVHPDAAPSCITAMSPIAPGLFIICMNHVVMYSLGGGAAFSICTVVKSPLEVSRKLLHRLIIKMLWTFDKKTGFYLILARNKMLIFWKRAYWQWWIQKCQWKNQCFRLWSIDLSCFWTSPFVFHIIPKSNPSSSFSKLLLTSALTGGYELFGGEKEANLHGARRCPARNDKIIDR